MKVTVRTKSSPQHGRWSGADEVAIDIHLKDRDTAEDAQNVLGSLTALLSVMGTPDSLVDPAEEESADTVGESLKEVPCGVPVAHAPHPWADDSRSPEPPTRHYCIGVTLEAEGSVGPVRVAQIARTIAEILQHSSQRVNESDMQFARRIVFNLDDQGMVK